MLPLLPGAALPLRAAASCIAGGCPGPASTEATVGVSWMAETMLRRRAGSPLTTNCIKDCCPPPGGHPTPSYDCAAAHDSVRSQDARTEKSARFHE